MTDESGKVIKWTVELAGRLNLSEAGWDEHTLQIGQRVEVTGRPARVDLPRIFFTRLVRADGTELNTAGGAALSEIERIRHRTSTSTAAAEVGGAADGYPVIYFFAARLAAQYFFILALTAFRWAALIPLLRRR